MNYYVYMIINKLNGKVYIGRCTDMDKCIDYYHQMANLEDSNEELSIPIIKAIRDDGIENFKIYLLGIGSSSSASSALSKRYIRQYDSSNPDKGYNIQSECKSRSMSKLNKDSKLTMIACINPKEKKFFVSQGLTTFGNHIGRRKDIVLKALKRPYCVDGWFVIYLDEIERMKMYEKAYTALYLSPKNLDKEFYDEYLDCVALVDLFMETFDKSILKGYECNFITPSNIEPIDAFINLQSCYRT